MWRPSLHSSVLIGWSHTVLVWDSVTLCTCVIVECCAQYQPASMISCHLSPSLPSPPPLPHPSLPQRKPAIQSGAEIKSLGAWPGPRPLANEVGERQPKSLPLGLYCLYRGLVIGGYGSGIKRLLPQPLRRVRHSLPPPLLFLTLPLLLLTHPSILFLRKRKERPSDWVHSRLSPLSPLPLLASLVSACCLPDMSYLCVCVCRLPVQLLPMLPCSVVLWLLAVSFHG